MAEASEKQFSTGRMWVAIVLGFVIALAVMVACAYLWVFLYSVFIYSGGDQAHYEAYAQVASPVVAVVMSFPVYFVVGRFMRRFGDKATFAALAAVGINLVVDALAMTTVEDGLGFGLAMSGLSAAGKIAGAYLGARRSNG